MSVSGSGRCFGESVAVLGFQDGVAGQVASWFEEATGYRIACFVHEGDGPPEVDPAVQNVGRVSQRTEYPSRESFAGRPLVASLDWIGELRRLGIGRVLPLNSDNRQRLAQIEACSAAGIELVSAVHPSALVLAEAIVEPGVWIAAGCVVGFKAELAAGVIMNTGAQVDHHNVLGRCCQVDPGVVTAGFVTLRECSHVHTGAVLINRVTIGADARVGAGAVVIRDVEEGTTVAGVPARRLSGDDGT